jgi:hypothetical protein
MGSRMTKSQGPAKTEPPPPGIRFTILKQDRKGAETEVDPSFVFQTGDKARLAIELNDDGYLYVLARNPADGSKLLFPSSDSMGSIDKTARVEKKVRYLIPAIGAFTFEDSGDQRVTILFSREPLSDLQNVVEASSPGEKAKTAKDGAGRAAKPGDQHAGPSDLPSVARLEITLKHQ